MILISVLLMGRHHGVQGWWKTWRSVGPTQSGHWCLGGCNACYNFTGLVAHFPWTNCSYFWFKAVSSIRITMVCRTYPTILKPRKILQGRAFVRMISNYSGSSHACISVFFDATLIVSCFSCILSSTNCRWDAQCTASCFAHILPLCIFPGDSWYHKLLFLHFYINNCCLM